MEVLALRARTSFKYPRLYGPACAHKKTCAFKKNQGRALKKNMLFFFYCTVFFLNWAPGPRAIVQLSCEKYFPIKFQNFRAKYFSSNQNFPSIVLDTVITKFDVTSANIISIKYIKW